MQKGCKCRKYLDDGGRAQKESIKNNIKHISFYISLWSPLWRKMMIIIVYVFAYEDIFLCFFVLFFIQLYYCHHHTIYREASTICINIHTQIHIFFICQDFHKLCKAFPYIRRASFFCFVCCRDANGQTYKRPHIPSISIK